jgi:MFS family permease
VPTWLGAFVSSLGSAIRNIDAFLKLGLVRGYSSRARHVVSEHRQRRRDLDRTISDQSRRGLDWTNFFVADVQVSFGAFLAFYLASAGWSWVDVGIALTVGGITGVLAQLPGGALTDSLHWKRAWAVVGIAAISVSAFILAIYPSFPMVITAEVLHGLSGAIVGPAIAAISLGLAGQQGMPLRTGRNFRFSAAGNALTALLMGGVAVSFHNHAIFLVAALLGIPAVIALAHIRADEIDYVRARNARKRDQGFDLDRVIDLFKNSKLLVFTGCMVIFQFSNAAVLPILGYNLGQSNTATSPVFMAGIAVVPQIIVALLAPWIGYWSELWGRKPLLLIAWTSQIVRVLLFTLTSDPRMMIAIQCLDGVTGAIITVLTILIITDVTKGTGRFNLAQGVFGTLTGFAAAISPGIFGALVLRLGDAAGLLTMAFALSVGMVLLWFAFPETKPKQYAD